MSSLEEGLGLAKLVRIESCIHEVTSYLDIHDIIQLVSTRNKSIRSLVLDNLRCVAIRGSAIKSYTIPFLVHFIRKEKLNSLTLDNVECAQSADIFSLQFPLVSSLILRSISFQSNAILKFSSHLTHLELKNVNVSDSADYKFIAEHFPSLQSLSISNVDGRLLSEDDVAFICSRLEKLTKLTVGTLLYLTKLPAISERMKYLTVTDCVSVNCIKPCITSMPSYLSLVECNFSNVAINCRNIQIIVEYSLELATLKIHNCKSLVGSLSLSCPSIQTIAVTHCTGIKNLVLQIPRVLQVDFTGTTNVEIFILDSGRLEYLNLFNFSKLLYFHSMNLVCDLGLVNCTSLGNFSVAQSQFVSDLIQCHLSRYPSSDNSAKLSDCLAMWRGNNIERIKINLINLIVSCFDIYKLAHFDNAAVSASKLLSQDIYSNYLAGRLVNCFIGSEVLKSYALANRI